MLEGIIIKGIGGFYYVKTDSSIIECKARGKFRNKKIKPLVGDRVKVKLTHEDNKGVIEEIENRKNVLIRPPVANIDQAVIVFALKKPDPNLWLLDRFLMMAENENIDIIICINKIDLGSKEEMNYIKKNYDLAGYKVITTNGKNEINTESLKEILKNKISVFAGPSGVGKSTLLNSVQPNLSLKTGEISEKTNRGKHTTRSANLLELDIGGWVVDTPGFSSLNINFADEDNLDYFFKEIYEYKNMCKFTGCKHHKEPKCAVKEALEEGQISKDRYNNYIKFLHEIKNNRRY
ncbi:MAG: ribosome small subunit-dependent GTPase A [Firmicutes bacterium]|nr:ribosome small subunit-dependent GTPase A [Bacillota bacterium]